jgi:hypothetical protein
MTTEIDIVITELEVLIGHDDTAHTGKVSFVFLDQTPHFPKVNSLLRQIEEQPDAYVINHSISTKDIDENTNLSGLEFTIH